MKINNVSQNTSFGRLKINVDKDLLMFSPIKKELNQLKKIFKENGFSRKKNVDVILDYDVEQRSFVGIVESKKQGIPNNPGYKQSVSTKKSSIEAFKNWLENWDYMYSPKGLSEWRKIRERALEEMQKPRPIVSIWKI